MKSNFITILLLLLFGMVGLLVHFKPDDNYKPKIQRLQSSFDSIPNWTLVGLIPVDEKIKDALELDDYLFQRYVNKGQVVTLYIGYYHSAKKVGAAHDPMVCLPGQGWKIYNQSKGVAKISKDKKTALSYATITAGLGEQSEFILYWFQAYDEPTSTTLMQKFKLLTKSFQRKGQDNAFVRVSLACAVKDVAQCEQTLLRFADDFYPVFLGFITLP